MKNIHNDLIFSMQCEEPSIRGCDHAETFVKIRRYHKNATCHFDVKLMNKYNPLTLKFDMEVKLSVLLFNN